MKKKQKLKLERTTVANLETVRGGAAEVSDACPTYYLTCVTFIAGRCTRLTNPWPPPVVPTTQPE